MGLRELVFAVTYDEGIDPLADIFIEHPELFSQSLTCTVTPDTVWYLERFTGPPTPLERLDDIFAELTACESETTGDRQYANWQYKVISANPRSRTVCAYGTEIDTHRSIPHLAAVHIDTGLLYETERRGDRCRWRILLPQDVPATELYTSIQHSLPTSLAVEFEHVSEPENWGDDTVSLADIPYEQREVLEVAVTNGYYETPREISAQELAEKLEIPQSTLQYRLSRAEAWLATQFVDKISPTKDQQEAI